MGEGTYIQGSIQFDYGINTKIGKNCFMNFNFVVLNIIGGNRLWNI